MRSGWRGLTGAALAVALVLGSEASSTSFTHAAASTAPQALAYVANNQVQVFEAGTLTTAGPGQSPVWSPNGASLLFSHFDYVANTADILLADSHGANARAVISGAYPYLQPSWSPDSKSIVYAAPQPGAKPTGASVPLQIKAYNPTTKQSRLLGKITVTGGCSQSGTALEAAAGLAEGAPKGMPSTLIWAQPNLVVAQSSCGGVGLTLLPLGGKSTTLKGWSGAVLAPNGKTIAAVVSTKAGKQVGFIAVATRKTTIARANLGAAVLTWARDSNSVIGIAEPLNPANGTARVFSLSTDGRSVAYYASIPCAGAYHPSVDRTGKSLALAVVASAPATAVSVPSISIDLVPLQSMGAARPFFIGSAPAWRP